MGHCRLLAWAAHQMPEFHGASFRKGPRVWKNPGTDMVGPPSVVGQGLESLLLLFPLWLFCLPLLLPTQQGPSYVVDRRGSLSPTCPQAQSWALGSHRYHAFPSV